MRCKIMTVSSLENSTERLKGVLALVYLLCEIVEVSSIPEDAVRGVADLLETVCRDFQADIDAAENVNREEGRTDG